MISLESLYCNFFTTFKMKGFVYFLHIECCQSIFRCWWNDSSFITEKFLKFFSRDNDPIESYTSFIFVSALKIRRLVVNPGCHIDITIWSSWMSGSCGSLFFLTCRRSIRSRFSSFSWSTIKDSSYEFWISHCIRSRTVAVPVRLDVTVSPNLSTVCSWVDGVIRFTGAWVWAM